MRFTSSLVRLRTLDLGDCSGQLVDVSLLSSLTLLNALFLDFTRRGIYHLSQLADVSPLSFLVALETLHLINWVWTVDIFVTSVNSHLLDQLGPVLLWSAIE